jgi:exonuclease SbcC
MLERLEMHGFEGYSQAVVNFSRGLNLVVGRNSTGKTTILDAIFFALYGEIPEVEKKLLVSRLQESNKTMVLKLKFRLPDGRGVEIWREGKLYSRSGSEEGFRSGKFKLLVNDKEVQVGGDEDLRKRIAELTGISLRKFTNLVYVRQGELNRILEPNKDDMDSVLGINVMREIAEELDQARRQLEKYEGNDVKTYMRRIEEDQLPRIQSQLVDFRGQVDILRGEVEKLKSKVETAESNELKYLLEKVKTRNEAWQKKQEAYNRAQGLMGQKGVPNLGELRKLAELARQTSIALKLETERLKTQRDSKENEFKQIEKRVNRIIELLELVKIASIERLESSVEEENTKVTELDGKITDAQEEFEKTEKAKNELEGETKSLEKELLSHNRLLKEGIRNCPTCGQNVSESVLIQIVEEKKTRLLELCKKLGTAKTEYDESRNLRDGLRESREQTKRRAETLESTHAEVTRNLQGESFQSLNENRGLAKNMYEKLKDQYDEANGKYGGSRLATSELDGIVGNVENLLNKAEECNRTAEEAVESIGKHLEKLKLPLKPDDESLETRIAEKFPLSLEEVERARRQFNEKKNQLDDLVLRMNQVEHQKQECEELSLLLDRRKKEAESAGELCQKFKMGVEIRRKSIIREIAYKALAIYNSLTDQHVYKALRIDPDNYIVQVQPSSLGTYIPAKRVGGGHQTLLALSMRLALLEVLGHKQMLILDEPTYGVDSENIPQLLGHITEASRNVSQVILVTHYGIGEEEASNIIRVGIGSDGASRAETAI